jgi:hypothetical protein
MVEATMDATSDALPRDALPDRPCLAAVMLVAGGPSRACRTAGRRTGTPAVKRIAAQAQAVPAVTRA